MTPTPPPTINLDRDVFEALVNVYATASTLGQYPVQLTDHLALVSAVDCCLLAINQRTQVWNTEMHATITALNIEQTRLRDMDQGVGKSADPVTGWQAIVATRPEPTAVEKLPPNASKEAVAKMQAEAHEVIAKQASGWQTHVIGAWQAHVVAHPREEFLATFREAHAALHQLWTTARDREGYNKAQWNAIYTALSRFARDAALQVGIGHAEPLL